MKILSIVNGVPPRFSTGGTVCVTDVNNIQEFHVFALVHELETGEMVHAFDYNVPHDQGMQDHLNEWRPQQVVSFPISDLVYDRFKQITNDFLEMDKVGGLPFYYDRLARYCADQGPTHITRDGIPITPDGREITERTLDKRTKQNPFNLHRAPMNCFVLLALALEFSGAPLGLLRPQNGIKQRNFFRLTSILRGLKDQEVRDIPVLPSNNVSGKLSEIMAMATATLKIPSLSKTYEFPNPRSLGKRGSHIMRHADFLSSADRFEGRQTMLPWYIVDAYARVLGRAPDAQLFPKQGGKIGLLQGVTQDQMTLAR